MTKSCLLLAVATAHFAAVLWVSSAQIFTVVGQGHTLLSFALTNDAQTSSTSSPSQNHELLQSVRRFTRTYLHLAGIEAGYGLFAPNVPDGYRLKFEVRDGSGIIQNGVISPQRGETDLRLASGLDVLGRTVPSEIREILVKLVAESLFAAQPEAKEITLAIEEVATPTVAEFQAGKERSYTPVYSYDYGRGEAVPP
jgi:hypothetical protein